MRATPGAKQAQRIAMLAIAMLSAAEARSQSADDSECRTALVASSGAVTMPQLGDLSYRCMKLTDGRHIWVGVANETAVDTVLLIHGLGNNAHLDWRSVVPSLLPRFRIVAVDLPGFGASPASPTGYSFEGISDALVEVLDQLKVSRTHVVGHSLGGAVSLHFTHAHPDRVERLTLIDAAGILHRIMVVRYLARIDTPRTGIAMFDRLSSTVERAINDQVTLRLLRSVDSREEFSNWLKNNPSIRNAMIGSRTQVDAALGLVEYDFTETIRTTNAPTTIFWGRDDSITPVRTGEMLAARMPDARIHILDGVGHVPMTEAANFNGLLLDALLHDLPPKFAATPADAQQNVVECQDQAGAKFTGHIATLTIKRCSNVIVEFAQIGKMTIESSSVTIRYSSIENSETALTVDRSRVNATAVDIKGAVAVAASGSELDFAGVTLTGSKQAVDIRGTRIYFSVSEINSPTYNGNVHAYWTKAP